MTRAACALLVFVAGCDTGPKARPSEAQVNLERIARSAKAHAIKAGRFPVGSAGPVPAQECCGQPPHKCQPDVRQWDASPWRELGFVVEAAHYYRYAYTSDGTTFTATAVGDLDCDYETVTWKVTGKIVNGNATTSDLERPTNRD